MSDPSETHEPVSDPTLPAPETKQGSESDKQEPLGVLAEFNTPAELVAAAEVMREDGFTKLEAFSPFPVHGIDEALRIKPSPLPWMTLAAGLTGGVVALGFQWWTNTVDYPYLISGKPMFSLPANIPVTFEVIILLAAFATFFGMLMLNGLPKLSNPLLRNERFRRATDDGFFLWLDAGDQQFSDSAPAHIKGRTSAIHVETLEKTVTSSKIPRGFALAATVLASFAVLPPLMIAKARATTSDQPRIHNFFNMDFQPKLKAQNTSTLFADGRAMRPRVAGTVPRGTVVDDPRFLYGIEPHAKETQTVQVSLSQQDDGRDQGSETSDTAEPPLPNYVEKAPVEVDLPLMERGQVQFNIHCAVCHGKSGYGNGLVSQRALELQQGTWVPPTSLHSPHLLEQPDGQIFNSITNGVRKMPSYGHQIPPEDRWAIVAYIRALQRSQNAEIDDVPEDYRNTLREFN